MGAPRGRFLFGVGCAFLDRTGGWSIRSGWLGGCPGRSSRAPVLSRDAHSATGEFPGEETGIQSGARRPEAVGASFEVSASMECLRLDRAVDDDYIYPIQKVWQTPTWGRAAERL